MTWKPRIIFRWCEHTWWKLVCMTTRIFALGSLVLLQCKMGGIFKLVNAEQFIQPFFAMYVVHNSFFLSTWKPVALKALVGFHAFPFFTTDIKRKYFNKRLWNKKEALVETCVQQIMKACKMLFHQARTESFQLPWPLKFGILKTKRVFLYCPSISTNSPWTRRWVSLSSERPF